MLRRRPLTVALVSAGLLAAVGIGTASLLTVPPAGWTTGDITTGASRDYPDLVSHRYDMPVDNTTLFAAEAARRLPRGRVVITDPAHGIVRAEVRRTFPIPITDDVTMTVVPDGDGSRVMIRSRSRNDKADLGANARHIRDLQAAMDARLPQATN
jgi:uncharacterized protein (DUF1499 family)